MPQSKPAQNLPGWKMFRLPDGTRRIMPVWADKPLGFTFDPDEALKRGAITKPKKSWGKVIVTGRKSRR